MHIAVISALPARESAARGAFRDRGTAGIHFESARRFSGFYAPPRRPFEYFFGEKRFPFEEYGMRFSVLNTSRARVPNTTLQTKIAKSRCFLYCFAHPLRKHA